MPDYQGIGLGTKFLNTIAKLYVKQGYDFSIVTSAKNLINSLRKNTYWCLCSYNKGGKPGEKSIYKKFRNVYTASFMYKK